MSEVLSGYQTGNNGFKAWSLAARNFAMKVGYIHHMRDQGIIKNGDRVLELGCGQGHKLETCVHSFTGATFTGLELHSQMLGKAKKRLPDIEIIQGDMTCKEDIPDGIDVACYFQSLHHLNSQNRGVASEVIHKKLNSSGRVVVIDTFDPNKVLQRAYAVLSQYPGHKAIQFYHSMRSLIYSGDYLPEDYGYFPISHHNALGENQAELFSMREPITPFFGKAISDILIFDKK